MDRGSHRGRPESTGGSWFFRLSPYGGLNRLDGDGDTGRVETSQGWEFIAAVVEGGSLLIDGIDPWGVDWEAVPVGSVVLDDPVYVGRQHTLTAYRLAGVEPVVLFAAGELSNGVWGFYEPTDRMRRFLLSRVG